MITIKQRMRSVCGRANLFQIDANSESAPIFHPIGNLLPFRRHLLELCCPSFRFCPHLTIGSIYILKRFLASAFLSKALSSRQPYLRKAAP